MQETETHSAGKHQLLLLMNKMLSNIFYGHIKDMVIDFSNNLKIEISQLT